MKKLLVLLALIPKLLLGQLLIYNDNMEASGYTWRGVPKLGIHTSYVGGSTTAADLPATTPQYSSVDTSLRILGTGAGSSPIERDTIVFPSLSINPGVAYQVKFRVASVAYTPTTNPAAGLDVSDYVQLEYTTNGGTSYNKEIKLTGSSNANWGYSNTTTILKIANGLLSTYNGPASIIRLNLPIGATQIGLQIIMSVNANGESVLIDDVELYSVSALPITLDYFTASTKNSTIELKWRTQSETNNDYFSIYKSQHGLEYWQLVANVQGTGNSSIPNDYNYIDPYPVNGLNYYVLMQTDYDGRREQFPPIVIMFAPTPVQSIWDKYNFLGQEIK